MVHQHPALSRPITFGVFCAEFTLLWMRAGLRGPNPRVTISRKLAQTHCKQPRRYAEVDVTTREFFFAPQVLALPRPNRRGLIAHEIGHVLVPEGDEFEADQAAHDFLGVEISYDDRWAGCAPDGRCGLQTGRDLIA